MGLYQILFFIALVPGVLLIAALGTQRRNRSANRLLAGVVVSALYFQFAYLFQFIRGVEAVPYLIRSSFPLSLAAPAFLYGYVLYLTRPSFRPPLRFWGILFLPSFAALAWFLGALAFARETDLFRDSALLNWERYGRLVTACGVFGVFTLLSLRQLQRFSRNVAKVRSNLHSVRLAWLRLLLTALAIVWALVFAEVVRGPGVRIVPLLVFTITLLVLSLAFLALRQSLLFSAEDESVVREEGSEKTQGLLSDVELKRWGEKLRTYMETEKPYVNPELRLPDLARMLGTKPYLLSQIINRSENVNFFEFVNRYRVEEAKRRLADAAYRHMNILGIALESGFNSKSAFNESFRRIVGKPPSTYRADSTT